MPPPGHTGFARGPVGNDRSTHIESTLNTCGHRQDVCDVNEPAGYAGDLVQILVFDLGEDTPQVAGRGQQLADLGELLARVTVVLVGGVEREPDHSDRVGL